MEEKLAVEVQNLSFGYAPEALVLRGLSMSVRQGEVVCILGHSGCGKSTLLSLLMGLFEPASGIVKINGETSHGPDTDRAIVFQDYSLFPWMTVRKNVVFGAEHSRKISKKKAEALADDYLTQVGLRESRAKYPYQLSGGMKQRAAIARALAMDSGIWLFDEPFSALDPQMRSSLQSLVMELAKKEPKRTVLFVTHNVDEAIALGERIFFMAGGGIYKDIKVPFAYPRIRKEITVLPEYFSLAGELANLFYETRKKEEKTA